MYLLHKTANDRGILWELDEAFVFGLWQKPCYYCNVPMEMVGLDRVDNDIGYTVENTVPCCTMCNIMKQSFGVDAFIARVHLIAANHPVAS